MIKNEGDMGGLKGVYDTTLLRIDEICDVWELRLDAGVEPKRPRIKINASAGSSEAAKWGEGKSRQDEMEYRLWLMDDLLGKLQDGRAEALQRVCSYPLPSFAAWQSAQSYERIHTHLVHSSSLLTL